VNETDSIPTRQSLLVRLKDLGDQESWREFFDAYWRLIHAAALKAGLTEPEAQDVVQEVMVAATKKMRQFTYDPAKDSLKGWLLAVTRWKVADQFRKRNANPPPLSFPLGRSLAEAQSGDHADRTATVQCVPDSSFLPEEVWDGEWRESLLRVALDRVKRRVNPAHYEMYHLHAVQGLSAKKAGHALGVSTAAVHLAKHRVGRLIRLELKKLADLKSF